jgi:hypothetical protein
MVGTARPGMERHKFKHTTGSNRLQVGETAAFAVEAAKVAAAAQRWDTAEVRTPEREKDEIRTYVVTQAHDDVIHLEKVGSELVGPVRHDIWDVHCRESRWWVVTNPTNLYDQADFKSRDVVLTFHVGLTMRVAYARERDVPVTPGSAELLPGSWRRWQQAFGAYESGDEAETFQSVGVRLRECLVSFVGETRNDDLVPPGQTPPKASDFKGWAELLANGLAAGESAARLRSYLKKLAVETWEYVNWFTHAKNRIASVCSARRRCHSKVRAVARPPLAQPATWSRAQTIVRRDWGESRDR